MDTVDAESQENLAQQWAQVSGHAKLVRDLLDLPDALHPWEARAKEKGLKRQREGDGATGC